MDKEQALHIIAKYITPCMNNGYKVTEEAITDIVIDCKVLPPCAEAMKVVAEWFNSHLVVNKCNIDRDRYVGALLNLFVLLATNDIASLMTNWVLDGLEEEINE